MIAVNALFKKAYAYLSLGEVTQAEKNLPQILSFCKTSGCEHIGTSADTLSSVIAVAKGNVASGVKALNRHARRALAKEKPCHAQTIYYMLGRLYQSQKRKHLAAPLIKESIALFELLGADGHSKRAQSALNTLE